MDENIHKEDEPFKKAYERMEEDPSPEAWEKISSRLDKSDAIYYRNKFVTWQRIAVLLLLLLGAAILYHLLSPEEKGSSSTEDVINRKEGSDKIRPSQQPEADNQNSLSPKETKPADSINIASHDERNHTTGSEVSAHDNHQPYLPAQSSTETAGSLASAQSEIVGKKSNANSPESVPADSTDNAVSRADNRSQSVMLPDVKQADELTNKNSSGESSSSSQSVGRNGLQHQAEDSFSVFNPSPAERFDAIKPAIKDSDKSQTNSLETAKEKQLQKQDSLNRNILLNGYSEDKKNTVVKANKTGQIKPKPFARNWSVIPFASADFAGYSLDDDHDHDDDDMPNGQPEHRDHRNEIKEREENRFSFSAGALAKWQFSQKVSFRTGLVYSKIAIGIQPQTLYAIENSSQQINYKFISSTGYAYVKPATGNAPATGDSITSDYANSSLQVLCIPLSAGYTLPLGKRFFITLNFGVAANFLLSTKLRTELNESTGKESVAINKLQGTRSIYASLFADAELHYMLSNRINLVLLPAFRYAVNPVTRENVVKTFPYSFSMGAGISYRF